ncbi:sigma-54 dependent transcriptional regulator [Acidipila sp. EB88]|uniref:sigma-54-dependent transcriptional regulator n=1 Tax=Acidipila sp. EB88 TaxID=2305226 RepID=UPI001F23AE57|nr:sigma-54 dependent transcriptional regulator [Acidipila sp. EB88]
MHVLILDEDAAVRSAVCEIASARGHQPHTVDSVDAARSYLRGNSADVLLLDLKSPSGKAMDLLDEVKSMRPETSVIVMTAYATVTSAVEAMRTGATDYLTKPFSMDELAVVLDRTAEKRELDSESRRLRERLRSQGTLGTIVGQSPEMDKLYRILSKVAHSNHPVMILGESGTGKELVARSIHTNGANAQQPFLPVDCGSLVPTLVESELFGYVKGAFTGATRNKDGLLVAAGQGTVFLDEIGELPLDLQAKLLRALQEREVRPVGANHRQPMRARILAATNRDLKQMVEQGRFRKDLYYRLNVVSLRIPALRERRQDIPLLTAHFLDRIGKEYGKSFELSDDALRVLDEYDWPGNVRELENALERSCSFASGTVVQLGDMPTNLQDFRMQQRHATTPLRAVLEAAAVSAPGVTSLAEMEKQAILDTIRRLNGDKLQAARLLGIGKTTLYRKLKEYGIGDVMLQAR